MVAGGSWELMEGCGRLVPLVWADGAEGGGGGSGGGGAGGGGLSRSRESGWTRRD